MTTWIRVTAIPNPEHADAAARAKILLNVDKVTCFQQAPEQPVQVWFSIAAGIPSIMVVESLDDIENQLKPGAAGRVPIDEITAREMNLAASRRSRQS